MAFIMSGSNVLSFAEYEDVLATDQRLFEANEGLTEVIVEDAAVKATARILNNIRASDWWKQYYIKNTASRAGVVVAQGISVPALDTSKIKARTSDFTDLCVYFTLSEILLPKVADFGNADNAERQKIGFYDEKYRALFKDLIEAGDWYDLDGTGTVSDSEKDPNRQNLVRRR
jgi:hypothetical protein